MWLSAARALDAHHQGLFVSLVEDSANQASIVLFD